MGNAQVKRYPLPSGRHVIYCKYGVLITEIYRVEVGDDAIIEFSCGNTRDLVHILVQHPETIVMQR